MIPSDQAPPDVTWLQRRVDELERQVRELAAARRLESSTIGGGGTLNVKYPNGNTAMIVGAHQTGAGTPITGIQIRRPDGDLVLWSYARDDGSGLHFWAMYDLSGNIIMSDDAVSGQGVGRPWIPYNYRPTGDFASPPQTTTSATFTPLWTIFGLKQHPKITVYLLVKCDVGTAAEWQLKDTLSGSVIAGPQPISAGDFSYFELNGPVSGGFNTYMKVDVEVRRTAGAGSVRTLIAHTMGRQS